MDAMHRALMEQLKSSMDQRRVGCLDALKHANRLSILFRISNFEFWIDLIGVNIEIERRERTSIGRPKLHLVYVLWRLVLLINIKWATQRIKLVFNSFLGSSWFFDVLSHRPYFV